jgi:hypothetical protein
MSLVPAGYYLPGIGLIGLGVTGIGFVGIMVIFADNVALLAPVIHEPIIG